MKILKKDKVMVIAGRDKGKQGEVLAAFPADNKIVVEGVNIAKRHSKPSQLNPKGGIVEITKPIDVSKVMVIDPVSGKPARGKKERIYKVSKFKNTKVKKDIKKADTKGGKK